MSPQLRTPGAGRVWRILLLSQLREQPGRLLTTVIAIALGVALAASVYLVNAAALGECADADGGKHDRRAPSPLAAVADPNTSSSAANGNRLLAASGPLCACA